MITDDLKLVTEKQQWPELFMDGAFPIIAGPCSVESEEQIMEAAGIVASCGADILRGGTFKTRTSPYSFQGLGLEGLKLLRKAGDEYGLPILTEVLDVRDVETVCLESDFVQIGARNMQNIALLEEVGRMGKPVILKRGMNATIREWLCCAEYIMKCGNHQIILCERGIRTFETYTRNTLDLSAVSAVAQLAQLPVIVDPSHGTGHASMVRSMSLAAVMAGANGLEIEMHPNPQAARSDSSQQIDGEMLIALVSDVRKTVRFLGDM